MPRLRRCSGATRVALLQPLRFAVDRQRGSHMKLVRSTPTGRQVLVVPNHSSQSPHRLVHKACIGSAPVPLVPWFQD